MVVCYLDADFATAVELDSSVRLAGYGNIVGILPLQTHTKGKRLAFFDSRTQAEHSRIQTK